MQQTSNYTNNICPQGHYCLEGTKHAVEYPCNAGFFNPKLGAENISSCLLCSAGSYCQGYGNVNPTNSCAAGYYCPGGNTVATPTATQCQPGYYCPIGSVNMTYCTAGSYCNAPRLSAPAGLCSEGFYCPIGSKSEEEMECPPGFFCRSGSPSPTACPTGTYLPSTKAVNISNCLDCDHGSYCGEKNLSRVSGPCNAGFYCPEGQERPDPPAFVCPTGHYCQSNVGFPTRCENGTYQNENGTSVCKTCEAGYFCDNTLEPVTTLSGRKCIAGHYCPQGTRYANEFGCLLGSYSNRTGLNTSSQCDPCPPR